MLSQELFLEMKESILEKHESLFNVVSLVSLLKTDESILTIKFGWEYPELIRESQEKEFTACCGHSREVGLHFLDADDTTSFRHVSEIVDSLPSVLHERECLEILFRI